MNNQEYVDIRNKGYKIFQGIDHKKNLISKINNELNDIINFLSKPIDEIEKYQIKKLSTIVDYAFLNIPLYREKYSKVGYKVGSINSFEDFEKLPILYKDELINGFPNKIVKNIDDFMFSTRSSGSSGKFVTLAVDLDAIYTDTLQGIRQSINQSSHTYDKDKTVLFIYTCPWWIKSIDGKYKLDFLPTTTKPIDALEYIKQTKPFIISTYPTYLQEFCKYKINLKEYGVSLVIVHSEQTTKEFRCTMAKQLGVAVLDEYSSEELTRIALECPCGNYHLEEDACYIEVLDKNTKEKITQGTGLVVGTNLLNTATPIIRYHQGDIVTISNVNNCKCGNHGRIIKEINGREMDCIISDNKQIPASSFMDLAYNWFLTYNIPIHGLKYQIVQTSRNNIVINLEKGLYNLSKENLEKIKNSLYTLISKNINIEIKFTNDFIMKSNKFKPVINLIGE